MAHIRTIIVSSDSGYASALNNMLNRAPSVFKVLANTRFEDALTRASSFQPDLILIVAGQEELPFSLLEELRALCPHTSLFVVAERGDTGVPHDRMAKELLRVGVDGWVDAVPPGNLPRILELVSRGNVAVWPRGSLAHLRRTITGAHSLLGEPGQKLTVREREVLQLVLRKMSNKEIARQLFISESTVKTHVRNILQKFGAKNKAVLISNAAATGLSCPENG